MDDRKVFEEWYKDLDTPVAVLQKGMQEAQEILDRLSVNWTWEEQKELSERAEYILRTAIWEAKNKLTARSE